MILPLSDVLKNMVVQFFQVSEQILDILLDAGKIIDVFIVNVGVGLISL